MPGFTFQQLYSSEQSIAKVLLDSQFDQKRLAVLDEKQCRLFADFYAAYPIQKWETGDCIVLLEGMIYDQPEEVVKTKVNNFCTGQYTAGQLQSWLHQRDGEFVLLIYRKTNQQLFLWNDWLGRLPVYLFQDRIQFVIGRDIRQLRHLAGITSFDPYALATTLLFRFALGDKSLWQNISYLPPGTLLKADCIKKSIEISDNQFLGFRTGDLKHYDAKIVLNDLTEAMQNRLEKVKSPALSLSGGLDSRLLAGIFKQIGLNIPAFTYQDAAGSANADLKSVNDTVTQLQWHQNHQIISLQNPTEEQMRQLIELKQGMNYAGMAFIIPFLEYFNNHHFSMFTGDGGDKVLADLRPSIRIKSFPALLNFLLHKFGRISLSQAAKWSGLEANALKTCLIEQLQSYDSSPAMAYTDFLLRERARKWLFEGEDRNRAFCWSTTPFYSQPFTPATLSVSMNQKANGKMFLELFRLLPGQLETIVNPNWNLALDKQQAIASLFARQRLKSRLPFLKKVIALRKNAQSASEGKGVKLVAKDIQALAGWGLSITPAEYQILKNVDLQLEIYGLSLLADPNI
ncbi:MAG: asparagine synthase-related protein [Bacteroidales bacterium]|jgi:asparagine synthase (glutamine-hydrolysing)|nr:asparagine synthase-related protein [Bacteroidales bacterium]HOI31722.1 asparagine synthase-related protein [Bacteroidales bacterium]